MTEVQPSKGMGQDRSRLEWRTCANGPIIVDHHSESELPTAIRNLFDTRQIHLDEVRLIPQAPGPRRGYPKYYSSSQDWSYACANGSLPPAIVGSKWEHEQTTASMMTLANGRILSGLCFALRAKLLDDSQIALIMGIVDQAYRDLGPASADRMGRSRA